MIIYGSDNDDWQMIWWWLDDDHTYDDQTDMIFVQNFTQPDFQAKSFAPQKCVIYDIFLAN